MSDPGVYHLNLSDYSGDISCNKVFIVNFSRPEGRIQDIKLQI
jgi:hypothetical protein